ncbi:hypothetical protein HN51_040142, partial [Arachis hypogaea]
MKVPECFGAIYVIISFIESNGSEIDHPVLITEYVCNPVQSRSKMRELLFETYGVPSI